MPTAVLVPATDKQLAFINSLRVERGMEPTSDGLEMLTKGAASELITKLLAMPKASVAKAAVTATPGMYAYADGIYKVKLSQAHRAYAEKLVLQHRKITFVYAPGIVAKLTPAHRMSLEAAKAYGIKTNHCVVCGRMLTNPVSVAEGIGPICAGRL